MSISENRSRRKPQISQIPPMSLSERNTDVADQATRPTPACSASTRFSFLACLAIFAREEEKKDHAELAKHAKLAFRLCKKTSQFEIPCSLFDIPSSSQRLRRSRILRRARAGGSFQRNCDLRNLRFLFLRNQSGIREEHPYRISQ